MVIPATPDSSIDLRAVTVRPTHGAREHRLRDRLAGERHYLRFHGIVGKGLRHVALHGGTWLAPGGWQPGASRPGARDRWIGWSRARKFRRLHLVRNNSRFVILTPRRVPDLASRVPGPVLRRLSADTGAAHGHPALPAETSVDVPRFTGACQRASDWRALGLTRGFARGSGGTARLHHHGQPGEILMYGPADAAAGATGRDGIPDAWNAQRHGDAAPMAAPRLRSLFECLGEVPEFRKARGKRYPLETVLTIAVAARPAACRGVTAFARFAALLPQERLKAAGAFFSPGRQRHTAPPVTTFHNILADLPPDTLDEAIGRWTAQRAGAGTPPAMDGKDIRGASRQTEDGRRMTVAAGGHGTGLVLRQVGVEDKSNGIPAVRALSGSLDVTGRVVTVDATRARHGTARSLPGRRADHPVTAVRDSRETIHDDPRAIDLTGAPSHETAARGHGRPGRRRCATVDLTGAEWDGQSALHGRRQAIRAGRGREVPRTGGRSLEVTLCLTSLGPERAGPEAPAGLVRNHWTIGNRVHHLRDFTCDGDRCRAHVRNPPRNLSRLTNAAIAIVRCDGRFGHMPEANRHQSARAREAPGLIPGPPGT